MFEFLAAFAIAACAALFGARVLSILGVKPRALELPCFALAAGLAVYSLYSFAALALGVAGVGATVLLMALSLAIGWREFPSLKGSLAAWRQEFSGAATLFEKVALALLVFLLLLHAVASLAPPSTPVSGPVDQDSLVYHLMLPASWLQQGGFVRMDWLPHANWPTAFEAVYALAMPLGSEVAARCLSLFTSLVFVLFIYALSKRFMARDAALAAAAVFLSIPVVNFSFGSGYVDLHVAFFTVAFAAVALDWLERPSAGIAVLAGLLAGAAAATKLLGGVWVVALLLPVVLMALREGKARGVLAKHAVFFVLAAFIVIAPWLAKTFLWFGNPVWPLCHPAFEAVGFNCAGIGHFNSVWAASSAASGFGRSIAAALQLPWNLTTHGRAFNGMISSLLLALLPLFIFARRQRELDAFAVAALLMAVAWFFLYQETRFLLPCLALLAVLCGFGLQAGVRTPLARNVLLALVLLVLFSQFAVTLAYKRAALPVALGLETREAFLLRTHDNYAACAWANENLPGNSTIVFFATDAGYYCRRSVVYSNYVDFREAADAQGLQELLRGFKATHVLVNLNAQEELAQEGYPPALLFRQLQARSKAVFESHGVKLFELNPR